MNTIDGKIFDVYFVSYYNKVQAQKRRAPAGTLFPFRFLVNTIGGEILRCFFIFERCDLEVEPQLDDILQGDTLDAPHAPLYQTL